MNKYYTIEVGPPNKRVAFLNPNQLRDFIFPQAADRGLIARHNHEVVLMVLSSLEALRNFGRRLMEL